MKHLTLIVAILILAFPNLSTAEVKPLTNSVSTGLQTAHPQYRFSKNIDVPVAFVNLRLESPTGLFLNAISYHEAGRGAPELVGNPGNQLFLFGGWKTSVGPIDATLYGNYVNRPDVDDWNELDLVVGGLTLASKPLKLATDLTVKFEITTEWLTRVGNLGDFDQDAVSIRPGFTFTHKNVFGLKGVTLTEQLTAQWNTNFERFESDQSFLQGNFAISLPIVDSWELKVGYFGMMQVSGDNLRNKHQYEDMTYFSIGTKF